MQSCALSFLLVILAILNSIGAEYYNIIIPTKIDCNANPKMISQYYCELKPISRTRKIINMWGNFTHPMYAFNVDIRLFKKTINNGWRPYFLKFKINFCDFLNGSKTHGALKIIEPLIKKYSNMIHPCPYKEAYLKNLDLGVRNFFDTKGTLLPSGEFKLSWEIHDGEKNYLGRIIFQAEVKEVKD